VDHKKRRPFKPWSAGVIWSARKPIPICFYFNVAFLAGNIPDGWDGMTMSNKPSARRNFKGGTGWPLGDWMPLLRECGANAARMRREYANLWRHNRRNKREEQTAIRTLYAPRSPEGTWDQIVFVLLFF